jgi:hypothetical protein
MLFFRKRSHKEIEHDIQRKEVLIEHNKEKFHNRVNKDLSSIGKINKVLGNGITLSIHQATSGGVKHG